MSTSEKDVAEAAERVARVRGSERVSDVYGVTDSRAWQMLAADELLLADAYLSRLAADRAEREERARPIDADLPKRIGNLSLDEWCDYWRDGDQSYRDALSIDDIRGDVIAAALLVRKLLDLLRVLKGGAE